MDYHLCPDYLHSKAVITTTNILLGPPTTDKRLCSSPLKRFSIAKIEFLWRARGAMAPLFLPPMVLLNGSCYQKKVAMSNNNLIHSATVRTRGATTVALAEAGT